MYDDVKEIEPTFHWEVKHDLAEPRIMRFKVTSFDDRLQLPWREKTFVSVLPACPECLGENLFTDLQNSDVGLGCRRTSDRMSRCSRAR